MAMDIGPGAKVITTPLSFTATATAIVAANAVPVFADIDPDTLCLDPHAVERAITPHTRAIVPVHWCGNAGDFAPLLALAERRGLRVLEDAAQAPGTRYGERFGAFGDAGVFSFSEPKNVTTGEGGMIITSDARLAKNARLIRNHGEAIPGAEDDDEYVMNTVGFNFRMVEATAALGRVQTAKLSMVNAIRHANHAYLTARIASQFSAVLTPQRLTHPDSFAAYTAVYRWSEAQSRLSRNVVAKALRAEGIPVATGVSRLMSDSHPMFTRQLAFGRSGWPFSATQPHYDAAQLPHAHRVHDHEYLGFFLMGWPNGEADMDDIVRAFEKIIHHRHALASAISAGDDGPVSLAGSRGR